MKKRNLEKEEMETFKRFVELNGLARAFIDDTSSISYEEYEKRIVKILANFDNIISYQQKRVDDLITIRNDILSLTSEVMCSYKKAIHNTE